jgi:hypothetical protein
VNEENRATPSKAFAAMRDVENLEDSVDRLSRIVDKALERMEAIVIKLNDGTTKFALLEAEIERQRERISECEEELEDLRDVSITRETLSAELRPLIAEQMKAEDERLWLRRLIYGALIAAVLALFCGCTTRSDSRLGIVHHSDFSELVPWICAACVLGMALSIAAIIWVPIQRWIPLFTLTTFATCLAMTLFVQAIIPWIPWVLLAAVVLGAGYLILHIRQVVEALRRTWHDDAAPTPPVITKVLG